MPASLHVPRPAADGVTREAPALAPIDERERLRDAERSQQPQPGRYLAVPEGSDVRLVPLRDPITRIGRSLSADVVLEHTSVSRRHALIVRRDERSVLLDDRSLNGITLNGIRVTEAPLDHGDEIQLGRVVVRYLEIAS